jgi:hypothetical protein
VRLKSGVVRTAGQSAVRPVEIAGTIATFAIVMPADAVAELYVGVR